MFLLPRRTMEQSTGHLVSAARRIVVLLRLDMDSSLFSDHGFQGLPGQVLCIDIEHSLPRRMTEWITEVFGSPREPADSLWCDVCV